MLPQSTTLHGRPCSPSGLRAAEALLSRLRRAEGLPASTSLAKLGALLLSAGIAFVAACTTTPRQGPIFVPVEDGRADTPSECVLLGKVDGPTSAWRLPRAAAEEQATNALRFSAAALGANYVRVESFTWLSRGSRGFRGSAHGTAFRCKSDERPMSGVECRSEPGMTTCVPKWPR